MQLTSVLALLGFSTVLSAPAVPLKDDETDTRIKGPSDTLELQLNGFNPPGPIINTHKIQPTRDESEFTAENIDQPEVKRSERVDVEDEVAEEDGDVSDNMALADEEVKTVLKTFFQNLKHHPEIVEDILEREGAKLMHSNVLLEGGEQEQQEGGKQEQQAEEDQSASEESEERPLVEDNNTGDVPLDKSAFQKPSPQLIKSPKQVEKKAGPLAGPPQYIYKSPMRNAKERDELTARSHNNPDNLVISDSDSSDTAPHVDIGNAIPVIHQPSNQLEAAEEAEALLSNPAEGGDIDLAELQRAEEEYNREHPFINTLPIFQVQPETEDSEDVAKEEGSDEQVEKSAEESEESESQEADDMASEESQSEEKRSDSEVTSEENSSETDAEADADADADADAEETDGKWSETQVVDTPQNTEDVSAESQEVGKAPPQLRPNAYYYYYNENDLKDDDLLNVSEEGEEEDGAAEGEKESEENNNELQLQKISNEANSEEEVSQSNEEEEESDDKVEEAPNEETEQPEVVETEHSEEVSENESQADDSQADDSASESDETPDAADTNTENNEVVDKNEADLLSLFRDAQQRHANRPIAGPPM